MAELAPAVAGQWASPRPGEAAGLAAFRREAMARFERAGLPGPRLERWRYTNLATLAQVPFAAPANDAGAIVLPEALLPAPALRLVLVNGRLRPDLAPLAALPEGLAVRSLAVALAGDPGLARTLAGPGEAEPMIDLNAALMADGVLIEVAPGAHITAPLELLSLGQAGPGAPIAFHPRHRLRLGEGASLTLIETHAGQGAYWSHPVLQATIGAGARLVHYRLMEDSPEAWQIAHAGIRVERGAAYDSLVLQGGGALARSAVKVVLAGEEASCSLSGLYLGRGRRHVDNTLEVVHAAPRTTSRQLFKGVLADRSRGVFQGRIVVERDAQKSDGQQLTRALLLSDGAEIDTKPELEIYADDVKCSHGAAAGDLDEEALFYLRARGIDREAARRMLIEGFLSELVEAVEPEPLRAALGARVTAWLAGLDREDGR